MHHITLCLAFCVVLKSCDPVGQSILPLNLLYLCLLGLNCDCSILVTFNHIGTHSKKVNENRKIFQNLEPFHCRHA